VSLKAAGPGLLATERARENPNPQSPARLQAPGSGATVARMRPMRLALAQMLCRPLPPIVSQRLRDLIYPARIAHRDAHIFLGKSLTGSSLTGTTADHHAYRFCVHGFFDWRNLALAIALCDEGDTIIEVGANIGTETIGFSDIVGPSGAVHAFEPVPENLAALQKTLALNPDTNVIVHNCAISDRNGHVTFAEPPRHQSGLGHIAGSEEPAGEHIQVECVTLDSLAGQIGPARMIFSDTEGHETSVLRGGRNYIREHHPHLVIEAKAKYLKRAGSSLDELVDELRSLGYEIQAIVRFGLKSLPPAGELLEGNWLAVHLSKREEARGMGRFLLRCAMMPCAVGSNPLLGPRRRRRPARQP